MKTPFPSSVFGEFPDHDQIQVTIPLEAPDVTVTRPGELVQLVGHDHKYFIVRLEQGEQLQTHRGVLLHDHLIGQPWGSEVRSHNGHSFYIFPPSFSDMVRDIKRASQIIYPKDLGYILLKLSVAPGQTVVEAGTGSGGLTTILAMAVGPQGRVVSYDIREDMQTLARKNLERVGLAERVSFKLRDLAEGVEETGADAFFLDVPRPQDYMLQVRAALKGGGFFGSIVPTTNQVSDLLAALQRDRFGFVEVCEMMQRFYKTVPQRIRPVDRMVAHTGYLVFARPVFRLVEEADTVAVEEDPENSR